MTSLTANFRRVWRRDPSPTPAAPATAPATVDASPSLDIGPDDPALAYFAEARGAVDLDSVDLDSPAIRSLREAGMQLVVPLVTHGELVGLLSLGPRLSEQGYTREDRKLLDDLAGYAAPAVRVAQLVRQQQEEAEQRSRIDQELRVATLIQQQFLPKQLPELPGWQVAAHYQPAREVGGDFYDFIELPDGQVGVVVGDVTDKGVPAALIMAKTHSILRADAPRLVSPGAVLARANALLVAEMPPNMFVTCLYAVLDPGSGRLRYANAGHPVPYVAGAGGVSELRATGMPLGLLPDMTYDEREAVLAPGQALLLHSDGIAEAHGEGREMFGFARLAEIVGAGPGGQELIDRVLSTLRAFVGTEREQEDDITLVTLQRSATAAEGGDQLLADFTLPSVPGNERQAMDRVAGAAAALALPPAQLERLKTAVSEAAMNAIEHGNAGNPDLPVRIEVLADAHALRVRITDCGPGPGDVDADAPDIDAKLAGLQSPRGWGLFLIRNMVDDLRVSGTDEHHTLELVLRRNGGGDASRTG